jgi:hypothetical protein
MGLSMFPIPTEWVAPIQPPLRRFSDLKRPSTK